MTNRELVDAAWAEVVTSTISGAEWQKRVTYGYKGKPYNWQATAFGRAKVLLDQVADCPVGQPPPLGYPASYYAGPLGQNNILPKKPGALLIEYYGGGGVNWTGPGTPTTVTVKVPQREAAIGRMFDGIHFQYWGGGYTATGLFGLFENELNENRIQWIHSRGQVPVVSWSPYYSISQVNAGVADAVFAYAADYFKTMPCKVMLRMFWEFDNTSGFPWAVGNSANIGQPFVAAWRRVVNIFKSRGASNVGFWWCPLEGSPDRLGITASYPGDSYVDWVGSDAYNGCYVTDPSCWSTPNHSGWATWQDVAAYKNYLNQHDQWGPRKPFVYGEVGCVYDPNGPVGLKGDWFRALPETTKTLLPHCVGISFFDQDVSGFEGSKSNWLVDNPASNPDVMAGFKQMAADPWLNTAA